MDAASSWGVGPQDCPALAGGAQVLGQGSALLSDRLQWDSSTTWWCSLESGARRTGSWVFLPSDDSATFQGEPSSVVSRPDHVPSAPEMVLLGIESFSCSLD